MKIKKTLQKIERWWVRNIRKPLARWWPCDFEGCGFRVPGNMSSGEIELVLNVEGREGSVWLSKPMWYHIGARAGWATEKEALDVWNEETKK